VKLLIKRPSLLWICALIAGCSLIFLPGSPAFANCTMVGTIWNCDSSSPNPYPTIIGAGPASNNITLTLQSGSSSATAAQIVVGNSTAIGLGNFVTVNIGANSVVSNTALGVGALAPIANDPNVSGGDTINVISGSVINIAQGALVQAAGTNPNSEAVNPQGDGTSIINHGTIQGGPSSAIYFDNSFTIGQKNVIDNFGTIIAGANNQAFGANSSSGITFTQESGAVVQGDLSFDNGNNTYHVYTGSTVNGLITAGTGSNTVILDGAGTDSSPGVFTNFATLIKQGTGTWTLTGSPIGAGALPVTATVNNGKLVLTGNNNAFNGTMTVNPLGTLSGAAASIMPLVTDNGLVQFNQSTNQTYSGLIQGTGVVQKIGPAALIIDNNQPYTGGTNVTAGTLAVGSFPGSPGTLSGCGPTQISAGANLTGYGSICGTVTNHGVVGAGNSLAPLTGSPIGTLTIGGMQNMGSINIASSTTPGNVLAVQGNYSGSSGSTLTLGTVLNAGGPLSNQITDRLLIGGNATGNTSMNFQTLGLGQGTGPQSATSGISVVQVAGTSSATAFTLPTGYITGGSPYLYHLNAYGPGSPNGSADSTQNLVGFPASFWDYRLQSVYESGGPPVQPTRLAVVPQLATYVSAPMGLFSAQLEDLSEMHRRLGEIMIDDQVGSHAQDEVFMRGYGSKLQYTTNQNFANYGYNFSDNYAALQIGSNHMMINNANGKFRAGLAGILGHLWLKPSEMTKSKGSFNTQSLAAIFTWESRKELYVDAIFSGGLFSGPVTTVSRGSVISLAGNSLAASLEVGYPFNLGWHQLMLEPEAQLAVGYLKFSNGVDIDTVPIDLGKQSQAILRAGARLIHGIEMYYLPEMRLNSYLEANVLQDLSSTHTMLIGNVPFVSGSYGSAVQLRGGVNGNIMKRLSAFSDVAWQYTPGNAGFRGWAFNLGLRYVF